MRKIGFWKLKFVIMGIEEFERLLESPMSALPFPKYFWLYDKGVLTEVRQVKDPKELSHFWAHVDGRRMFQIRDTFPNVFGSTVTLIRSEKGRGK